MGHLEPDPAAARSPLNAAGRAGRRRRLTVGIGLAGALLAAGCAGTTMGLFSGQRPARLGVIDGRLQPIDTSKRNAVSSLAEGSHRIDPLAAGDDPAAGFERLAAIVAAQPRATVIERSLTYLYAEFRSRWFGFVDDVEFLLDADARLIHVRSASRLGYSDLGVNRDRIEHLRAALLAQSHPGSGQRAP